MDNEEIPQNEKEQNTEDLAVVTTVNTLTILNCLPDVYESHKLVSN